MYYDINLKKTKNICFLVILIIVLAICVNIVLYVGLVCAYKFFFCTQINYVLLAIQMDADDNGASMTGLILIIKLYLIHMQINVKAIVEHTLFCVRKCFFLFIIINHIYIKFQEKL